MASKHWVARAVQGLEESLSPVPHESNEIDWKVSLSDRKERLAEHLMALANHPNGGFLAFGVGDADARLESIGQEAVAEIANTLANLGAGCSRTTFGHRSCCRRVSRRAHPAGVRSGTGEQTSTSARKVYRGNLGAFGRDDAQGIAPGGRCIDAQ